MLTDNNISLKAVLKSGMMTALALMTVNLSCCKDDDDDKPKPGKTDQKEETQRQADIDTFGTRRHKVYVAFDYEGDNSNAGYYQTEYLVTVDKSGTRNYTQGNQQVTQLQTPIANSKVNANSICVADSNVYVGGTVNSEPVYWVNGKYNLLSSNGMGGVVTSIVVKNGHVYCVGDVSFFSSTGLSDQAVCWVDGEMTKLPGGTIARSVAVDNAGNIFIAGENLEDVMTERTSLRYWVWKQPIGGQPQQYSLNSSSVNSSAPVSSIDIDNTHYSSDGMPFICITGTEYLPGGYSNKQWVNLVPSELCLPANGNEVADTYAQRGKLYSCGVDARRATYWVAEIGPTGKASGVSPVYLTTSNEQAYAVAISICNDDVYVVGYSPVSATQVKPYLWRNDGDHVASEFPMLNGKPNTLRDVYVVSEIIAYPQ